MQRLPLPHKLPQVGQQPHAAPDVLVPVVSALVVLEGEDDPEVEAYEHQVNVKPNVAPVRGALAVLEGVDNLEAFTCHAASSNKVHVGTTKGN